MGDGGTVVIVNATKFNWQRTYQHSYQMNNWNFPEVVGAWEKVTVYVEWDQNVFDNWGDDGGEAEYTFQDPNGKLRTEKFQFQARWPGGGVGGYTSPDQRKIQVVYTGIQVNGQSVGSEGATVSLGWAHDGCMNFVLTGESPYFGTGAPPYASSWIYDLSQVWVRPWTLRNMCIPGSHDSGMSTINGHTAYGKACNTQTQKYSVGGQLDRGVRYFDLRPVIGPGGDYFTGHYSKIGDFLDQGANGQSIDSIVSEVNTFMNTCPELIVLRFKNDLNTNVGQGNYRPFNQSEYDGLLNKLSALRYRYDGPGEFDLTSVPITSFVSKTRGTALVVCWPDDSTVTIPNSEGFYSIKNFPFYDNYSHTNDLQAMQNDQISKMKNWRSDPGNAGEYVLSWTLTQSDEQAFDCGGGPGDSILALANEANPTLYDQLWRVLTPAVYPNVLYTDNVKDTTNLGLAFAINYMLYAAPRMATVSLRAHANNRYVTADNAGKSPLIANRTAIGSWETFGLINNPDGSVSFRAYANNQIVCADSGGASPLIANRTAIGPWESFDLINNADRSVSFRAHANGKIVCADSAGASSLIANRTAIGPWESFDLIRG